MHSDGRKDPLLKSANGPAGKAASAPPEGLWQKLLAFNPLARRRGRRPAPGSETPENFRSAPYWEQRYKAGGDSGKGSYGKLAEFKAKFVNNFIREHQIKRLLDFGCGDGNQAGSLQVEKYLGFDVAESAVARCRKKFKNDPSKRFVVYDPALFKAEAAVFKPELTLSMDVVFHLVEEEVFAGYMLELFNTSPKYAVIYSTNFERKNASPHHVDREFTRHIAAHFPEWELIQSVVNPYKGIEVQADFFVYATRSGKPG